MIPPSVINALQNGVNHFVQHLPQYVAFWKNSVLPTQKVELQEKMRKTLSDLKTDQDQAAQSVSGKKTGEDSGNEEI